MRRAAWTTACLGLLLLSGCVDDGGEAVEGGDGTSAPLQVSVLLEGEQAWPMVPVAGGSVDVPFEVPAGTQRVLLTYNWQGQYPSGFSADRAWYVVDAAGDETALLDGDLPLNPYACTTDRCGPAENRTLSLVDPEPGTWHLSFRGAYTATGYFLVEAFAPAPQTP